MTPEMQRFLDEVLDDGVKPHVRLIAPIGANGDVAVVAFEPRALARSALLSLGWDEEAPVFALTDARRERLAEAWREADDEIGARWLAHGPLDGAFRILVFARAKPLLLNFRMNRGYALEPGTLSPVLEP